MGGIHLSSEKLQEIAEAGRNALLEGRSTAYVRQMVATMRQALVNQGGDAVAPEERAAPGSADPAVGDGGSADAPVGDGGASGSAAGPPVGDGQASGSADSVGDRGGAAKIPGPTLASGDDFAMTAADSDPAAGPEGPVDDAEGAEEELPEEDCNVE